MSENNRRIPGITARTTKLRGTVYEVRWRQPNGREVSRTFSSLREAKAWRVNQEQRRNTGEWIDPRSGKVTFEHWAQSWLSINPNKRERTLHRDKQVLLVVLPSIGARPLASLTQADCRKLVNSWQSVGYAPSTIRRQAAVVKAILNSAVEAELISRSPWRGIRLPADVHKPRTTLSGIDVLSIAEECGSCNGLVVLTAALCGLRFGECAALRICDLDASNGFVTVSQSLGEVNGRVVVNAPKSNAGHRTMGMPLALSKQLKEHIESTRFDASPNDYVFVSPGGGPLRYTNFRSRVFGPACKRLGFTNTTFHDLRRFNATVMVGAGVDLKTAQVRLGHADPRLTLALYAQATTAGDLSAVGALERSVAI